MGERWLGLDRWWLGGSGTAAGKSGTFEIGLMVTGGIPGRPSLRRRVSAARPATARAVVYVRAAGQVSNPAGSAVYTRRAMQGANGRAPRLALVGAERAKYAAGALCTHAASREANAARAWSRGLCALSRE